MDALATGLLGAAILLLVLLLPRLLGASQNKKGWSMLIMGPAGAGKTSLFVRLRDGKLRNTVTSMQPNECKVEVSDRKRVHVIDLPGHPRLEESYFQKEVVNAKGVVVVVDSINFNASKDEFARQMYRLLTSPVIRGRGVPILVACNKSDGGAKAHTIEFIRKRTEKLVYELYQADVGDSMRDASAREHDILGGNADEFKFADLALKRRFHRPIEVTFERISVKVGDIDAVRRFVAACK